MTKHDLDSRARGHLVQIRMRGAPNDEPLDDGCGASSPGLGAKALAPTPVLWQVQPSCDILPMPEQRQEEQTKDEPARVDRVRVVALVL